jgi:predicted metal-dependent hydrolase
MGEVLRVGKPAIDIRVRRSGQARRFVLRVAGRGAAPVMTVPAGASLAEARRFASAQEAWLRRTLAALPQPVAVTAGTRLPVAGREAVVVPGERARHDPEAGLLMLPGPGNRLAAQAAAFLHEAARAACPARWRISPGWSGGATGRSACAIRGRAGARARRGAT